MQLAGVRLPDEHVDEAHAAAVEPVQLPHRVDASTCHGARVADEVEQHRLPSQVAEPHPLSVGRPKLEVGYC